MAHIKDDGCRLVIIPLHRNIELPGNGPRPGFGAALRRQDSDRLGPHTRRDRLAIRHRQPELPT